MTGRYATPLLECDLVMKGGITSGVIYPLAICRLAERYRLRDIGGASAGAIAAVAAGAAEYGRQQGGGKPGAGFEGLESLPALLTEDVGPDRKSRLLSLFQPSDETRGIFSIVLFAIGRRPWLEKALAISASVLAAEPESALLGLVAAVLLIVFVAIGTTGVGAYVMAGMGALTLLVVGILISIAQFVLSSLRALGPGNGYGMCSGHSAGAGEPALTPWLTRVLDDLAGVGEGSPITFGDLKRQQISLSLTTTDLTHGRPHRLPFSDAALANFFFRRSEFKRLFPQRVFDRMVSGAEARLAAGAAVAREALRDLHAAVNDGPVQDYLPFPAEDDLPLVVGARMSLSFPMLLQAIPLYAVDWTLESNHTGPRKLERCWFSDGGICSNLPIHFFDALLPGRPTFALDVTNPHPDHPVRIPPFAPGTSERDNVWVAKNNVTGIAETWNRFDQGRRSVPLLSFVAAMVETMQSWNDNLTAHYPGYRDRIVHISHTYDEGGLNLNMPKELIERLSNRGAAAGEVLRERFDPATGGGGWSNHLWVRYRTLLAMLGDQAHSLVLALDPASELEALRAAPPSYRFENAAQTAAAYKVSDILLNLAQTLEAVQPPLSEGAPKPLADLRGRPRTA